MRLHARALVAAVAAGIALSGCSNDPGTTTTLSPTQRLAAAKQKVDAAGSVHLTLRSSGIPAKAAGVLGANGVGTHAPAFKGTLDARMAGVEARVDVVATGGTLYLKLPFTTTFAAVDPKQYHAPDPASLFSPSRGLSTLLTAAKDAKLGDRKRNGSEVLQTITGTIPGSEVVGLLGNGDRDAAYKAVYGITDPGGQLRTVAVTGPFFPGAAQATYTLTLDRYGPPVAITKP